MMMKGKGFFPTSILLPEEQYRALKKLVAEGRYESFSAAVRAAIALLLEREGVSVEEGGEKK